MPETDYFYNFGGVWHPPLFNIGGAYPMGSSVLTRHSRSGAVDPKARVRDMDLEGRDIDVLFPTVMVSVNLVEPIDLALALCRAYNDWISDFCREFPQRLKGLVVVCWKDPLQALEEIKRMIQGRGFVGVLGPSFMKDRNHDDPIFDPIYETCEKLNVPICLHTNQPGAPENLRFRQFPQFHAWTKSVSHMMALTSILGGGILDRFPRLRFALLEAGAGWVPYWMEKLEENYRSWRREKPHLYPKLERRPEEYVKGENLYYSCDPDGETLPYVVDLIGEDRILYASDYPHFDARYPNSVRMILGRPNLSDSAKKKILGENASKLFNLGSHT